MKFASRTHPWNVTPIEAVAIQKKLRAFVSLTWAHPSVSRVGGLDCSYARGSDEGYAAVVVMSWPQLEEIEVAWTKGAITFPYIPGLLTFREAPLLLHAWTKLHHYPDLIFVDGQGIAHPRRFGIASHIGVLVNMPSVGCAKTKLVGQYKEPHAERGRYSYLTDHGETIGAVVRTRKAVKPVFVSSGHRVNLRDSIKLILHCCNGYRLPEPIRRADKLSRKKLVKK